MAAGSVPKPRLGSRLQRLCEIQPACYTISKSQAEPPFHPRWAVCLRIPQGESLWYISPFFFFGWQFLLCPGQRAQDPKSWLATQRLPVLVHGTCKPPDRSALPECRPWRAGPGGGPHAAACPRDLFLAGPRLSPAPPSRPLSDGYTSVHWLIHSTNKQRFQRRQLGRLREGRRLLPRAPPSALLCELGPRAGHTALPETGSALFSGRLPAFWPSRNPQKPWPGSPPSREGSWLEEFVVICLPLPSDSGLKK